MLKRLKAGALAHPKPLSNDYLHKTVTCLKSPYKELIVRCGGTWWPTPASLESALNPAEVKEMGSKAKYDKLAGHLGKAFELLEAPFRGWSAKSELARTCPA